ncbi:MAG: cobyrinic acid a,c-diamide synthase [Spirochaetales bacterium]|nr:MAG: cobyrinic acid a,c-diamide synthase [Spirochaetales bacterium]
MADNAAGAVVIAVCGKGGVGKTTVSAIITRILLERAEARVLAIDADPAAGLAASLGFSPRVTVDDVRTRFIDELGKGVGGDRADILARLDHGLFGALEERGRLAFLAIGRPEKEGCYCRVNDLLKEIIAAIAGNFDYVVIDGEAGIEQINRRVMERVSHLLVVSDESARGIAVARTILDVARDAVQFRSAGFILNRSAGVSIVEGLPIPEGFGLLGRVPEDSALREHDVRGMTVFELEGSQALDAVRECLSAWKV